MAEESPNAGAKLGLVAALFLIAASALLFDIIYRGPATPIGSLPSSDRLLVVGLGGQTRRGAFREGRQAPRGTPPQTPPSRIGEERRRRSEQRREAERQRRQTPRQVRRYQVKDGQCLYTIAEEVYGSAARWPDIAQENGLTEPFLVSRGQILRLPE